MRFKAKALTVLAATSLLAMTAGRPFQASATTAPVVLGHQGQYITDSTGRVVIFHGFNMVAKIPPYEPSAIGFDADDAAFLASHGFNAVRLGVILEGLEPEPGEYNSSYLGSIKATADLLGRYGIKTLLDFHQDMYNDVFQGEGFPGWMVQDDGIPASPQAGFPGNYFTMTALNRAFDHLWANSAGPNGVGLQDWYAAAWGYVARAFAGDTAVLGYDLMNEPWPGSVWPTCFPPAGCPNFDTSTLASFDRRVSSAIRTVDRSHLIFQEPALPFDYSAPTYLANQGAPSNGFDFHVYCLAALGAPETPPTRAECNQIESTTVSNAVSQSAASDNALILSEFGATSDVSELNNVVSLADANNLPWLEWAYCACGDPTGAGNAEALVYNPAEPPTGTNVNNTVLDALDEPYPQAVSGTPLGYHFDPGTGTFTFTYTPVTPAGSPVRASTVIYVPKLQYPNGYQVAVQGATVTSATGASHLELKNDPAASSVSVTVTP